MPADQDVDRTEGELAQGGTRPIEPLDEPGSYAYLRIRATDRRGVHVNDSQLNKHLVGAERV